LEKSDYLTHFLDLAEEHLSLPVTHVSETKVNSLLELVVRTSSTGVSSDPYKDRLRVEFSSSSAYDQLMKINSMVGIDMKKHLQNLKSGQKSHLKDCLQKSNYSFSGVEDGPLSGILS
jgi:gamma-tubulin complex component 2